MPSASAPLARTPQNICLLHRVLSWYTYHWQCLALNRQGIFICSHDSRPFASTHSTSAPGTTEFRLTRMCGVPGSDHSTLCKHTSLAPEPVGVTQHDTGRKRSCWAARRRRRSPAAPAAPPAPLPVGQRRQHRGARVATAWAGRHAPWPNCRLPRNAVGAAICPIQIAGCCCTAGCCCDTGGTAVLGYCVQVPGLGVQHGLPLAHDAVLPLASQYLDEPTCICNKSIGRVGRLSGKRY